ncbi:hypothetical protein C5Y96_11250 [Blastopirellula marina]|uniref:Uncharacterized protein n=1 Tax=Blastopirellula marina TaxID=124 RepID=A0A2S8FNJ5_9BACT|nr:MULTISPECIES: hypothetical protein [Pirellulaceae]PQO33414.1 hypothetical protein C5Y96_11250 [Blastopirellula marina]RCS52504.1 hypothetical protein DTL36_11260 [Bremerella cremea]
MDRNPPFPQPSILHQASAVLVIVACLALTAICVVGLTSADPHDSVCAMILCPWPALLAGLQYWGAFRYGKISTAWVFVGLALFSCLLFLAGIQLLSVVVPSRNGYAGALNFSAVLIATLLISSGVTISNWSWFLELKQAEDLGLTPPRRVGISLKDLMLSVLAVSVVVGVFSFFYRETPTPNFGRVNNAADAPMSLPAGSRQIVYWKGANETVFQCQANEQAFLEWFDAGVGSFEARSAELPLQPITSRTSLERLTHVFEKDYLYERYSSTAGWNYRWRMEDRSLTITYDRTTQQVFCRSTSR